jgi:uncharacterized membrane protein
MSENIKLASLFIMAAFYAFAGISHFRSPKFFLKITPAWVPAPEEVNIIVGIIEVALAIGILIPQTRYYAAIGIIALLVAVFPGNVYHFQKALQKKKHVIPTLIRLPVQFLLVYWAYSFM